MSPGSASFNFTDANPTATTADFSVSIDWGDGSPSTTGSVTLNSGTFTVTGSHLYTEEGSYTVKVTVSDDGGSTTYKSGSATVADAGSTWRKRVPTCGSSMSP